MLEHGVDKSKPSNSVKRSCSRTDGDDFTAKRRTVDASEKSTLSSYGRERTPSYPVSSLYHSSQVEAEFSNATYFNHSRPSSVNCMGPVESTKRDMMERSDFPSYSFPNYDPEEGYPGQYEDLHDARRNHDMEMPSIPSIPSFSSPPTKRNRFNLSRYQLDQGDELLASVPASDPEEKPNRFKTQRERLMALEQSEQVSGGRSGPCFDEACLSPEGRGSSSHESQSQSHDSFMSQRERLRRFSSEQARHVSIPNEWEGETRLQEFVAFGNIEAALRPLGLMMARAALVSDSVTTRSHRRSTSSGPSCCHTSRSNPLTS